MVAQSQSLATEAYRVLRTNLQFAAVDRRMRTLTVTSPAPSEGKSITAANLAAALALADKRVVLLDADLRRPRQHRIFGLRNNIGLTTALVDEHPALDEILQQTTVQGLRVLTSGPLPPNPAELLGSTRMRELLAQLLAQADIVVIDTPPVTAVSDAAIISSQADGVLLVLDAGHTRREVARRAVLGPAERQCPRGWRPAEPRADRRVAAATITTTTSTATTPKTAAPAAGGTAPAAAQTVS